MYICLYTYTCIIHSTHMCSYSFSHAWYPGQVVCAVSMRGLWYLHALYIWGSLVDMRKASLVIAPCCALAEGCEHKLSIARARTNQLRHCSS